MAKRPKVLAFDVDADSLTTIRDAFPEWDVEVINGATTASLDRDWNPAGADLLVVGVRGGLAETLGLCRELRSQAGRAHVPLLVLVAPALRALVSGELGPSNHSCLALPVRASDLVGAVTLAQSGNRPGREALGPDGAGRGDPWRDEGGES